MKAHTPPPWNQLEWPQLLEAAREGNDAAVSEVFQRLNSYCVMVAGSQLSADLVPKTAVSDLAQRSLLEAFTQFDSFTGRSEAEIRAWLSTIVHHNAIDAARHFRGAQRRTNTREQRLDADRGTDEIAAPHRPPSLALRRREDDAALQRALAQLPPNQRRVVELRYRDGLDYRQIAAAMDLSEAAARKLCSRAIEVLRKRLAKDDDPRSRS